MAEFFIPHLRDDPAAAEAEWQCYLDQSDAPPDSRRVHKLTYHHGRDRYEVTVGEPRRQFRRKTGPRGGYITNADFERYGRDTGTVVSGIIDSGDLIYVWSYGPPFGGWANPSFVDRREIKRSGASSISTRRPRPQLPRKADGNMDATLRYTQLGFALTALLDRNEAVDPGETGKRIEDGTLFGWLKERFGPGIDLSLYGAEDEEAVLELFASLEGSADPVRKFFGVRHNGLALLAAYCFEALQQMHYLRQ